MNTFVPPVSYLHMNFICHNVHLLVTFITKRKVFFCKDVGCLYTLNKNRHTRIRSLNWGRLGVKGVDISSRLLEWKEYLNDISKFTQHIPFKSLLTDPEFFTRR